jgi:lysylphosphatidylglycerol synthetase-like protein (DUF2156 family)
MGFNRNVITKADIDSLANPNKPNPMTLVASPPSGFVQTLAPASAGQAVAAPAVAASPGASTSVTVPSQDDYLTKLAKFVPVEVLAAYLFTASVIDSNVTDTHDKATWLGGLLIGVLVLTVPYDRRVLGIVRWSQVAVSVVGMAVYVFAVGGWFATTTWYHQWYASIVVPLFGIVIAILKLPPLPPDPNG